jgi:hypothetical protein
MRILFIVAAVLLPAFVSAGSFLAAPAAPAPELSDIRFPEIRALARDPLAAPKAPPDACQFIRDALAAPSAREVIVPPGVYVCAAPVVMSRSGTSLHGRGATLRLADGAGSPLLVMGGLDDDSRGIPTPVEGLVVEGLTLDGNRARQPGECWGGPCDTGGTTGLRNSGLDLRGVRNATVRDVTIVGARSGGLVTERDCAGVHVDGLKASDSFYDGLSVNWTRDSVFENLELSGNAYAGLTMDGVVNGNVFRNGIVADNRDVGIFVRRANGNRFEGLTVARNRSHGVYLSDDDRRPGTCATNNVFAGLRVRGNGRDGFHMDGVCADDVVSGSDVSGNAGVPYSGAWIR